MLLCTCIYFVLETTDHYRVLIMQMMGSFPWQLRRVKNSAVQRQCLQSLFGFHLYSPLIALEPLDEFWPNVKCLQGSFENKVGGTGDSVEFLPTESRPTNRRKSVHETWNLSVPSQVDWVYRLNVRRKMSRSWVLGYFWKKSFWKCEVFAL